ncbi:unnamed protein product [Phyllotreta striolata]|uniref:lysozyme n=1 Tax=Phyllotreta striolata TaxID=444603 RepID=A0A9N9TNK5_PHYSR|nr:unnamed protein product [Phyllotreta striolata]
MKLALCLFVLALFLYESEAIKDWKQHPMYPCVKCLCHARSGCWIRQNCAKYSINFNYWKEAGSLVVNLDDPPNNVESYNACMKDENCIVGTIIQYTQQFGELDCNCDGKFDCKDRLAIHLFGASCERPNFGSDYSWRFNHCAASVGVKRMGSREGDSNCIEPKVV